MSQVDADFLPLAIELIDGDFPTAIIYRRISQALDSYDPTTGAVTKLEASHSINAGVLSSGRSEQGGSAEGRELRLWIHHGPGGLPFLPETGDRVEYLRGVWKVTTVDPTYHSDTLIASELTLDNDLSGADALGPPPLADHLVTDVGDFIITDTGYYIAVV